MKMNDIETLFIITGITQGFGKDIFLELLKITENITTINRHSFNYKENIIFDLNHIENMESQLFPELNRRIKAYKNIVIILNAAMIDPVKEVGNYESSDILKIINTNVISSILLTNFVIKQKKKGIVVHLTSGGIDFNFQGLGLYLSSKIAINKFFEICEVEKNTMKFISFEPGSMNTQMTKKLRDKNNHF